MSIRLQGARWLCALSFFAIAGCATAPRPVGPAEHGPWAGRLALQVADRPSDSFASAFELRGTPESGELTLHSPLGATLAVLSWRPDGATLQSGSETTEYASLDALLGQLTGAAIPVRALFDWLRGVDTQVAGWRADLSRWSEGRIAATRIAPPPQADLRVVLER